MNDRTTSNWRKRLGQAAMLAGLGLAVAGAAPGGARAAMAAPMLTPIAVSGAVQPVYWAYDRYGRRVWVERPHYRPPPPRYHHRRGWVDRYGRWHPYYR
jgi:hypothetical protein